MTQIDAVQCSLCHSARSASRMLFNYQLPEGQRPRYDGASAIIMDMHLCARCARKAFKHTKRFFGLKHFQTEEGDAVKD